jgi:hypothetical protein
MNGDDFMKWLKNMLVDIGISINNFKAIINRKLCDAGLGGQINLRTELEIKHIRNGKVIKKRRILDRCITDAFVADIVDALQGLTTPYANFNDYKYHGSGTGTGNEAAGDVALGTEVETRATGSQEEGVTGNIYKSIATITYTGSRAITEHGLFNASVSGTLMDRTKFAAINVIASDSVQFTYSASFTSGG